MTILSEKYYGAASLILRNREEEEKQRAEVGRGGDAPARVPSGETGRDTKRVTCGRRKHSLSRARNKLPRPYTVAQKKNKEKSATFASHVTDPPRASDTKRAGPSAITLEGANGRHAGYRGSLYMLP
ncbi:hypothetical protein MRX96_020567 [Rhipicephalus microplus]